ncbi:MAG TPA: exodeoxyribonuclease VII large subunit [Candidatus Binataceae bacterium]|nr:exodeoxyribonuclease VII large subunit [Candidatus Binataceae bacterium]
MGGQLDLALGPPRPRSSVLTVGALVRLVRDALDARFGDCWVTGEISNARFAASNHFYFTLKDADASINVVMFSSAKRRLRFKPADGMKVVVRGRVNIYETRGTLQFYAEEMEPRGAGALQIAFEQLKERLSKEGLFDAARKRELPYLPRTVGIVTALGGAGLRDILRVLLDRFPNLNVVIRPARVQGDGAADEIADAIADLNRHGRAEVIIVGRGGGSLEDLWAFNEEIVARAIFRSRIPIVSAVGHEIDYTIADFVADKRAPTPTFAAHMVVPARVELREQVGNLDRKLIASMRKMLEDLAEDVDYLAARVKHPRALMREAHERVDEVSDELANAMKARILDARRMVREHGGRLKPPSAIAREARLHARELTNRMAHAMTIRAHQLRASVERASNALVHSGNAVVDKNRAKLGSLATQLDATSPLRCLERGYAVVTNLRDGRAAMDAQTVQIGDELEIRLRRGKLRARTESREV